MRRRRQFVGGELDDIERLGRGHEHDHAVQLLRVVAVRAPLLSATMDPFVKHEVLRAVQISLQNDRETQAVSAGECEVLTLAISGSARNGCPKALGEFAEARNASRVPAERVSPWLAT